MVSTAFAAAGRERKRKRAGTNTGVVRMMLEAVSCSSSVRTSRRRIAGPVMIHCGFASSSRVRYAASAHCSGISHASRHSLTARCFLPHTRVYLAERDPDVSRLCRTLYIFVTRAPNHEIRNPREQRPIPSISAHETTVVQIYDV